MTNHHVIYIPGLGDHWDSSRKKALRSWRVFGVQSELVPMQWYDGLPYDQKFDRIHVAVQNALHAGKTVSLIGESAGASIALNYYSHHQKHIHKLVTMCGVVTPQVEVAPQIYTRSPAFKVSISKLAGSIKRTSTDDTIVMRSLYDKVVDNYYNVIEGARHVRLFSLGHFTSIAMCLTLYSWFVIAQIKQR